LAHRKYCPKTCFSNRFGDYSIDKNLINFAENDSAATERYEDCPDCGTVVEYGFKGYCGACYQWHRRHPGKTRRRGVSHKDCIICAAKKVLHWKEHEWITDLALSRYIGVSSTTLSSAHRLFNGNKHPLKGSLVFLRCAQFIRQKMAAQNRGR